MVVIVLEAGRNWVLKLKKKKQTKFHNYEEYNDVVLMIDFFLQEKVYGKYL